MTPAEQFEHEHTLQPPTDPRDVSAPEAYREEPDTKEVQIDPTKMVLVSQLRSCIVTGENGEPGVAFQIIGRINQSQDEAAVTFVTSLEAIGKIVAQLVELSVSAGESPANAFHQAMTEEMALQINNHQAYVEERHG